MVRARSFIAPLALWMALPLAGCGAAGTNSPTPAAAGSPDGGSGDPGSVTPSECDGTASLHTVSQGVIDATGVETNLAIHGLGYFPVSARGGEFYTRDGSFFLGAGGRLVNSFGAVLRGTNYDSNGVPTVFGDVNVASILRPQATTIVSLHLNLDASSVAPAAWALATPAATANYSTAVTVYDSLGASHRVDVYFRNTGAGGAWEWHAVVDGGELTDGVTGTPTEIANGTLTFVNDGSLQAAITAADSASFINAKPNQAINFDFGSTIATGGTGLDGTTSFASWSTVNLAAQDGYMSGRIVALKVSSNGDLLGDYDNGVASFVATLSLAHFDVPSRLSWVGGHLVAPTACSGPAFIGPTGLLERGWIQSGEIEEMPANMP